MPLKSPSLGSQTNELGGCTSGLDSTATFPFHPGAVTLRVLTKCYQDALGSRAIASIQLGNRAQICLSLALYYLWLPASSGD